jgi:hypothetical protein
LSKISLQGNNSGTGTFTLAAPNSSTDRTLDLPDASGVIDRLNRAGNVLQVVTNIIDTNGSVSGGSWQTIVSASITPSNASNKILILATAMFGNPNAGGGLEMGARIYNGSDAVVQGAANSSTTRAFLGSVIPSGSSGPYEAWTPTMICSETAGTTSSKTYSVQCYGSENESVYYNRTHQIGNEYTFSGVATITLMEIAV